MAEESPTDGSLCGTDGTPLPTSDYELIDFPVQGNYCGITPTPLPTNDPDLSNSSISAFPGRFGIHVHWSYPNLHPEAVAFSDLYRAETPSIEGSGSPSGSVVVLDATVGGEIGDRRIWLDLGGLDTNVPGGENGPVPGFSIGDEIIVTSTEDPNWGFQATVTGFYGYGTGIKTSQVDDIAIWQNQPGGKSVRKVTDTSVPVGGNHIARISADNYTDLLEEDQKGKTYYYWVQHTSIHGTTGDLIGPASATWHGSIDDILEWLQGLINESQLDEDLRRRIRDISGISTGLDNEIADRQGLGAALNELIAEIKADLRSTDALVGSAFTEIVDDNRALAAQVNIVMAQWETSFAGVQNEVFAVASTYDVLAGQITTIQSTMLRPGGNPDNPDDYYSIAIQEEFITSIQANLGDLDQLGHVPIYELDANGNIVLDADGNPVVVDNPTFADRMLDVYGQWSIRIDNNGHVSGLGLRSSGTGEEAFSEFIVNANVFAIGAPEDYNDTDFEDGLKRPFIVYQDGNGDSLIAMDTEVFIRNGTIKNAMIDNVIQSTNWNFNGGNFTGWQINKNGNAYFDNIVARGDIEATSIKAGTVNAVNTLMLEENAVTIPEGVVKHWAGTGGQHIEISRNPAGTNLASLWVRWGEDGVTPSAFIVNAIYQALGSPIGGGSSAEGDALIELVVEYQHDSEPQIDWESRHQILTSYSISLRPGYGSMVNGMWHVVPMSHPFGRPFDKAFFTVRGYTNQGSNANREVARAALSVLGAKR